MFLPIVAYGQSILRKVGVAIDAQYPQLNELIADMWETMYKSNGVGLAAPQINKAIRLSGGKRTFWEIRKYLPKETQNYVPKFLATAFLMTFSPPAEESANILRAHETLVPVYLC